MKVPNPEDDVVLPNGVEEAVPKGEAAGAAVLDAVKRLELPAPPNNDDPELVPNIGAPAVIGALEAAATGLPNPLNFGNSPFWSIPNDNFGASDENMPRFAGTPPSVVVVPISEENWIGFPPNRDDVDESPGFAENKLVDDKDDPPAALNKLEVGSVGAATLAVEDDDWMLLPNIPFFGTSSVVDELDVAPNESAEEVFGISVVDFEVPNNDDPGSAVVAVPNIDEAGVAVVAKDVSFFPKILDVVSSFCFVVPNKVLFPKREELDSA